MTAASAVCTLLAFLAGSIPFGVFLARRQGVDIRHEGSGNIGATNVARVLGLRVGLVVLILDAAKGALPVLATRAAGVDGWGLAAAGMAAVLGHCFSPWLRFRGGKGVATALGVFLVVAPAAAGVGVATFVVFAGLTRIPAIGSLAGAVAMAAVCVARGPTPIAALAVACTLLILVKHRGNIARVINRAGGR